MQPMRRSLLLTVLLSTLGFAASAEARPATVKVMTRNLYLGADLGPGMNAQDLQGLVDGAGQILNQVDQAVSIHTSPGRASDDINIIVLQYPAG